MSVWVLDAEGCHAVGALMTCMSAGCRGPERIYLAGVGNAGSAGRQCCQGAKGVLSPPSEL